MMAAKKRTWSTKEMPVRRKSLRQRGVLLTSKSAKSSAILLIPALLQTFASATVLRRFQALNRCERLPLSYHLQARDARLPIADFGLRNADLEEQKAVGSRQQKHFSCF